MANIRISSPPSEASPSASDVVPIDGATVRKTTLANLVSAGRPLASQAEAEAGTDAVKAMTPLTTAQAIASIGGAQFASSAQGALAATAVQPGDLSTVATSGDYDDLANKPTLGTAAAEDTTAFAAAVAAVPTGGSTGQVLGKVSGTDHAVQWQNAGAGDVLSVNNLSDLDDAASARSNLGLGSAAVVDLIDDDTMATATSSNVPSSESVKAYVDALKPIGLATVALAEGYTAPVAPPFVNVAGFYASGDGGDASYGNPTAGAATKSDQIELQINGSPVAYNRLHQAGEVDFAKHGLYLDGREEVAKFEDAFAVALDRGLKKLVMPGGRSLLLTEAVIPAGSFDVDFRRSTILADFNGSLTAATDNAIRALLGTDEDDLILRNFIIDGQYDGVTTLTAEARILDIEGYRRFGVKNGEIRNCGRGGSTETLILDRSDRAFNIHNCNEVYIDGLLLDGNAKFEGLVVQSSDKRTQYHIRSVRCVNQISTGSAVSVFNCAPGKVERCYLDGFEGSAMNILTERAEVCFNVVKNVSSSIGIDLYEGGGYYSHGSYVHHNHVENTSSAGIRGCGNGLRIEHNHLKDCRYGIEVVSNIGVVLYPTYGDWLTPAETEIGGIIIKGNTHEGHNYDNAADNANIRVIGDSAALISAEITVADNTHPTVKTEYGVVLEYVRNVKINGKLMHGRTALVQINNNATVVDTTGATFEPESGQGVDCILVNAGTVGNIIWGEGTNRVGSLDANFYDIARRSGGTITRITDRAPTAPTTSVPSTTLIERFGHVTGTTTWNPNNLVTGNGEQTTVTVTNAALGDVVEIGFNQDLQGCKMWGWVSAADTVTVRVENHTGSDKNIANGTVTAWVRKR